MKFKQSACIETLYCEKPFLERFSAAKADGFAGVEFWSWTDKDLSKVKEAAENAEITICGFNGDAELSLIDPDHNKNYLEFLKKSIAAAKQVGALSLTIHSNGLGEAGKVLNHYEKLSDTVKTCNMFYMLEQCAALAESEDILLNLEGLNIITDHVGNYLVNTSVAAEMCRIIGSDYLKVLYDVYHMQLNEGNLCNNIESFIDVIGHVHVADCPGRHEPGTGEIYYPKIYKTLANTGYGGYIGYELFPETTTKKAVEAIMSIV
ncbi:TIM barrel protein [Globicatella sulfidifaciens]|uniref:TIM barrel protein n=1 Tax=Globicatella sulfidifaciens TaxID=136093 RepID=A0A7X8C5B2_9LACT|nr:TIM barrel protein [Globicatella sulfidifaciens]NLJ19132.1 TIM barrel protein [Globicatella sulfidifaciens]